MDKPLAKDIIALIKEGVELEIAYAKDTMPKGILGMNAQLFEQYLYYMANRRLQQIGLPEQYKNSHNPFPWMSEMLDLPKEANFFERKVTEYQSGGVLEWD